MAGKSLLDLVIENPNGLGENPPAQVQAAPKVFFDEYGQPYDEKGNRIEVKTQDPTIGESLLNIAESPAKMLVGAVTEPVNALQRLAENSVDENGNIAIPNPENPQNQQDVLTGLVSIYGGNAMNPAAVIPKGALASGAFRELPMDAASRMARAKELGFDTDTTFYHGSPDARGILDNGFQTLKERYGSPDPEAVYFAAKDKRVADTYADDHRAFDYQNAEPATIPLYMNPGNQMTLDWGGKPFRGRMEDASGYNIHDYINQARDQGYDSVRINNVVDTYDAKGRPSTIVAVFDPSRFRHPDAAFDPSRASERGLLLSDTGKPSLMGSALAGAEAPRSLDVGRMREAQAAQPGEMSSLFADLRARGMLHSDTPMPRRSPDAAIDTWNQERQFENAFAQTPLQPGGAVHTTYPDDPSRFLSRFNHNGRIYEAEGTIGKDGAASLDWIGNEAAPLDSTADQNTVGRGALRAWKNSFLEQFPDVKSFSGERISGARAANDTDPMQTVSALFSDTGKPSIMGSAVAGAKANQPVRAFHSTDAQFDRFDPAFTDEVGFHFGNKDQAQTRQMVKGGITSFINPWSDWRTIPVNIETQNPAALSRDVQHFTGERVANQLVRDGIAPPSLLDDIAGASPEQQTKYVRDWLVSNGYDSVRYPNDFEGAGAPSYMALGTGNVKHAKTGDVLYAGAPPVVTTSDNQDQPLSLADLALIASNR